MEEHLYQNLGPKTFLVFILERNVFSFSLLFFTGIIIAAKIFLADSAQAVPYFYLFDYLIIGGLLLTVLFLVIGYLIAWLEHSRFKFRIDNDAFRITRGILTRIDVAIPYRNIQAVDITQSLLYQIFGVCHIYIEMLSQGDEDQNVKHEKNDEEIPAIDRPLAVMIQAELTKRANVLKYIYHERKI